MREILFRGKRTDNGEWVEGILFNAKEDIFIIPHGNEYSYDPIEGLAFDVYGCKVDPETVGQYTGLTDKNGVRIFEGDICGFKRFNDFHVGKIVFNVKTASFIMWYQLIVGAYGEKATQKMLLSVCDDIEVIGNIHDNPDILKGGEENG